MEHSHWMVYSQDQPRRRFIRPSAAAPSQCTRNQVATCASNGLRTSSTTVSLSLWPPRAPVCA